MSASPPTVQSSPTRLPRRPKWRTAPIAAFAGVRRIPRADQRRQPRIRARLPERAELKARLKAMAAEKIEIPLIIGGREIRTGKTEKSVMPHDHQHVLAEYHLAGPEHVQQAIAAAAEARREWAAWAWEDRAAVFLRAAELLATTGARRINAATMLGQSKTAFQAEIDAASRADRLLALQRLVRAGAVQRAADQQPGHVEPDGVPRRSRASSTRSRRSTSPRSAATCRPRRR